MLLETHNYLLQIGFKFAGESCGCGGAEKKRTYRKDDIRLFIYMKSQTYTTNGITKKPIQEIYTEFTA